MRDDRRLGLAPQQLPGVAHFGSQVKCARRHVPVPHVLTGTGRRAAMEGVSGRDQTKGGGGRWCWGEKELRLHGISVR